MKIIGPFESKNNSLTLLALTYDYLYLIRLSPISLLKYQVSLQIPFLFADHIDKIKSEKLENLKAKYSWTQLALNNGLTIHIEKNNKWYNTITLNGYNESYKLSVLKRDETDNYILVLQDYYGDLIEIS